MGNSIINGAYFGIKIIILSFVIIYMLYNIWSDTIFLTI